MDRFEKFEEQLIDSYKSTLAEEAREICKEIDSLIKDDKEFDIEKAESYCIFLLSYRKNSLNSQRFV